MIFEVMDFLRESGFSPDDERDGFFHFRSEKFWATVVHTEEEPIQLTYKTPNGVVLWSASFDDVAPAAIWQNAITEALSLNK